MSSISGFRNIVSRPKYICRKAVKLLLTQPRQGKVRSLAANRHASATAIHQFPKRCHIVLRDPFNGGSLVNLAAVYPGDLEPARNHSTVDFQEMGAPTGGIADEARRTLDQPRQLVVA